MRLANHETAEQSAEAIFYTPTVIMGIYLLYRVKQTAEPKDIYNYVWGAIGLDPQNKYLFIAYIVSGDSKYAGIYAYSAVLNMWGRVYV